MDHSKIGCLLLLTALCSDWTQGLAEGLTTTDMPHDTSSSVTLTSSAGVALVNDSLTFTCHVNGSLAGAAQPLSISHNGSPVCQISTITCMDIQGAQPCSCVVKSGVMMYLHHVTRVQKSHEGEWLCAVGDSSVSSLLVQAVAARPFDLRLTGVGGSSVTLKTGDQAVFRCSAQGDPHPDLTLTLEGNGTTLGTTNQSEASLTVNVTADLDGAIVNCLASNRYGNVSSNLQVNVQCAKTSTLVTVTPAIPLVGGTADVKCNVTQPPQSTPHDVVLAHNGDPVCAATLHSCLATGLLPHCGCVLEQGQTVYQFSISNVSQPDQGNWSCQVSPRCAQSATLMQVESSPFGVQFPDLGQNEVVTLTENEVTSVQCKAFGSPRPHITWSIKGNVTEGEEGEATLGTLRLLPSRTMHGQEVTCTATNKLGVATLRKRMVVFYASSEVPILTNATENVTEDDAVVLSCSVRGGNPPTSNVTLACGDQLSNTSADDVTLVFNASRELDGVQCVCSGQHSTGAYSLSSNTTLHVLYAPSATMSARFNSSAASVELVCRADGNPPSFHWTIQQRLGETTVRSLNGTEANDTYTVNLNDVTVEDTGTYVCLVRNSVGNNSSPSSPNASVDVRFEGVPLRAYDTPITVFAEVDTDAEIKVYLYSNPEISASYSFWRRNPTEPLDNRKYQYWIGSGMVNVQFHDTNGTMQGNVSVLRIVKFQVSDAGTYIHHVCNRIGCTTKSYTIAVSGNPWPPSHLQVVSSTEQSVTLQWTAGYPGGDFTVWFQIDYRRQGNENWTSVMTPVSHQEAGSHVTFTVDGLPPSQIFYFRVRAHSDRPGSSNSTEEALGATFVHAAAPGDGGIGKGVGIGVVVGAVIVTTFLALLVCLARRHGPGMQRIAKIFAVKDSTDREALTPDWTTVSRVPAINTAPWNFPENADLYSYTYSPEALYTHSSHHSGGEHDVRAPSTSHPPDSRHPPDTPARLYGRGEVGSYTNPDDSSINAEVHAASAPKDQAARKEPPLAPLGRSSTAPVGEHQRENFTDTDCSVRSNDRYDDAFSAPGVQPSTPPLPPQTYLLRGHKKSQAPPRREEMNTENLTTGPDCSSENPAFDGEDSVPPEAAAPLLSGSSSPNTGPENQAGGRLNETAASTVASASTRPRRHNYEDKVLENEVAEHAANNRNDTQEAGVTVDGETTYKKEPMSPEGSSASDEVSSGNYGSIDAMYVRTLRMEMDLQRKQISDLQQQQQRLETALAQNQDQASGGQLMPADETSMKHAAPVQETEDVSDHYYSACDTEETVPKTRREIERELQMVRDRMRNKRKAYEEWENRLMRRLQTPETKGVLESFTINALPLNSPPNDAGEGRSNTRETSF